MNINVTNLAYLKYAMKSYEEAYYAARLEKAMLMDLQAKVDEVATAIASAIVVAMPKALHKYVDSIGSSSLNSGYGKDTDYRLDIVVNWAEDSPPIVDDADGTMKNRFVDAFSQVVDTIEDAKSYDGQPYFILTKNGIPVRGTLCADTGRPAHA